MTDYERAKAAGRTGLHRWEDGIEHHPMSLRLMAFLKEHNFNDYGDYFGWKSGGDGDNGETLMFEMDAFFETASCMRENRCEILYPQKDEEQP